MTSSAGARGRPRSSATDQRITEAAVALLREGGPQAVTVDGVAHRSGAARTTVYRRYADRRALLAAVLDDLLDRPLPPPELELAEKLRWVLSQVEHLLEDGLGRGGLAAVLTGADPVFGSVLRRSLEAQLRVLRDQIRADVDAGRVAADVDPDALVSLVVGAYLGEAVRHGRPSARALDAVVDLLARVAVPKTAGSDEARAAHSSGER